MKVLLQRVTQASVDVDGKTVGAVGPGLLLLVGFGKDDSPAKLKPMAEKLVNMRIFADDQSHFNLSLLQTKGGVLIIPQFTLFADCTKGRRPEFFSSMPPEPAKELFLQFIETMNGTGISPVQQGEFGAHMHVKLENDGPVTIMVEM